MTQPKALYLCPVLPSSRSDGAQVVAQRFVEGLRDEGWRVSVLGYDAGSFPAAPGEASAGRRAVETRSAPLTALYWGAQALAQGRPYSTQKWVGGAYRRLVRQALEAERPDLVLVDQARMGWITAELAGLPVVFVCHNVEAHLYRDLAGRASGAARMVLRREARLAGRAERGLAAAALETWCLSRGDAAEFAAGKVRAFGVPIAAPPPGVVRANRRGGIALLGTWTWAPNRAGLDWFAQRVAPQLPRNLVVHVAGKGAEHLRGARPNLVVHGPVEQARPFLEDADCIIVPSIEGAGVQIKTLDAIATGLPVVATGLAARGLEDLPATVLVADEPEAFAARIVDAVSAGRQPEQAREALDWMQARERVFQAELATALGELRAGLEQVA